MSCQLRLHAIQHASEVKLIPAPPSPQHCVIVSCSCGRPVSHAVLSRQAVAGTICASHCCSKEAVLVSRRGVATCQALLAAAAACHRLRPAGPACALAAELASEAVQEGLLGSKVVTNLVSVCLQGRQAGSRLAQKTVQQQRL